MVKAESSAMSVSVTSEVDPGWVEFVTGGPEGFVDIFLRGHCGYWLEGVEHDMTLGWLAWEHAAEDRHATPEEKRVAGLAWRSGQPLPKGFHALSVEAAARCWAEGVKSKGVYFYGDGDGEDYDVVVQMGLLGEVTYG